MGLFREWEESKELNDFFNFIDGALETLQILTDRLAYEPYNEHVINHLIGHFTFTIDKMLNAFLETGNERLLGQIEEMQKLLKRLQKFKKNATAM